MSSATEPFSMNRTLASGPVVWAAIIAITCLLLVIFQTALWLVMPVFLAILFHLLLAPFVKFAMSRGLSRSRSVFLVTLVLWIFIIGACIGFGPRVLNTVQGYRTGHLQDYIKDTSALAGKVRTWILSKVPFHTASVQPVAPLPSRPVPPPSSAALGYGSSVLPAPPPPENASDEDLQNNIAAGLNRHSGDIASEAAHWIPSLLLVPYLTYFFLLDGPRFKRFIVQAIPNAFFEKTLYLFYRVEEQVRSYFRGVLLLTLLDGTCLGIGLWFFGVPAPFFLAAVAAVIAWLPYLGSIAGCLLAILVAHHHHPDNYLLLFEILGLFVVVRLCDDFIFMPMTVGRSLRMHPLVTVMMILLGGAVAGVAGLLLVMPVLGVVMVVGEIGGELLTDARVIARYRHARALRRERAQAGL
jgi:predicted PurR-regulated permease PerM